MSCLKLIIEIYLSIQLLLLLSSWCIDGHWLLNKPSVKLKLARLLIVSCVLAPIAVHCIKPEKHLVLKFVSLDTLQEYAKQPVLKAQNIISKVQSPAVTKIYNINYWQIVFILICTLSILRLPRFVAELKKLKIIVTSAMPYRACGRLVVKVSQHCHIPFSVRLWDKAYIILPLSLLASSQNVKIALAHEGQHHRNGDCLWAYFIEGARIIFYGNPGITNWHRILSDLQELSCDEVLISQKMIPAHDYGHCLFKVVQTVAQYSNATEQELACTVGMACSNDKQESKFITRRICMLSNYQLKNSKKTVFSMILAGIAVMAPICSAYAAMGSIFNVASVEIDTSSLHPKIQNIATAEITAAVKQYHAKSGVIAVADPSTGKIIAFAEAGKVSGDNSWRSRIFVPGSTIKPFIAAAALDSGVAYASQVYDCRSPLVIDGMKFVNSDNNLGSLTLANVIAKSANTCMIKVAQDTGPTILRKKLADFGFDMNSGWQANKSAAAQVAMISLGESVPVTMATLTNAYVVLANKGHLLPPNSGAAVSEATANSVTQMLIGAVNDGTGEKAAISNLAVAGKTGTVAHEGTDNMRLALFGGYVPARAPRLVIMVVIENGSSTENGKEATNGGTLAAPVFHDVAVKSLDVLKATA